MKPNSLASPLVDRITGPLERFLQLEAASSLLLLAATIVALAWANSPWHESYEHLLHVPLALRVGSAELELTLHHFVNDALMGLFFFVVGLEIKRELVLGELSTLRRALLPVIAAIGGMVVPAGIYAWLHWDGPALHGWGIPMATDIAFAVAALSVFAARVPPGLKIFLLALAIADDIGAVAVIAIFYTSGLALGWLAAAVAGLALTWAMNRVGVRAYGAYLIVGMLVWLETYQSGVHATIATVAIALMTPARPLDGHPSRETLVARGRELLERFGDLLEDESDHHAHGRHQVARAVARNARSALSPLDELMHLLHPWVAFVVMPLFALCNAGVRLDLATLLDPLPSRVALGVALGLLVGKPVGITLFTWLAVRSGLSELPRGVTWAPVVATGFLAGIGFTVALFVSSLAFDAPDLTAGSKVGILLGSTLAGAIGVGLLSRTLPSRASLPIVRD